MERAWNPDPSADFLRRWGTKASELGISGGREACPDVWEPGNGDVVVIGRDMTDAYADRLPSDVTVYADERLVVIPRSTFLAAKADSPDA